MTADDFFLLSVAFGGFLIFALVLWNVARIADRKQNEKRGPDIRPDAGPPSAANGPGWNEAAPSGRPNDARRRLAVRPATARHCIDMQGAVSKA